MLDTPGKCTSMSQEDEEVGEVGRHWIGGENRDILLLKYKITPTFSANISCFCFPFSQECRRVQPDGATEQLLLLQTQAYQ